MNTTLLHWLEFFLLPPGIILVLLLIGLILIHRKPYMSFFISLTGIILLALLSMPLVARYLLQNLQEYPALQLSEMTRQQSEGFIVIIGAGRYRSAPEYGYRDEISTLTLERLRYGAILAEKLDLPIVLSGGRRNADATPEAVMMNQVMVNVFNKNPQFLDVTGANTHQQAFEVKKILAGQGSNKIYLVTHAWHMKRAVAEFSQYGFEIMPVPMGFAATSHAENLFLPSAAALASCSRAIHEYYGLLYQKLNL